MWKTMAAVMLWGAVVFAAGDTASKQSPEQGAKEVSQKIEKAWNGADPKAFASLFSEKGSLITPFGEKATGRAEIEKLFGEHLQKDLKGTTMTMEMETVSPIGSDVAVADATQRIHRPAEQGAMKAETGAMKPETGTMRKSGEMPSQAHFTSVLQREGGSWKLVAVRAFFLAPKSSEKGVGGSGEEGMGGSGAAGQQPTGESDQQGLGGSSSKVAKEKVQPVR